MSITFEQIAEANATIVTRNIKGKEYAEVNQRVKAFRMVYPYGSIQTECVEDTGKRCTFRAKVFDGDGKLLGTGTAFEVKEGYINSTSYIENCETSAVGRALGFAGFGIDTAIASAEEVTNVIAKHDSKKPEMLNGEQNKAIQKLLADAPPERIDLFNKALDFYKVENIAQLTKAQGEKLIRRLGADA